MTHDRDPVPPKPRHDSVYCEIGDIHVRLRSDLKQALDDFARIYPVHVRNAGAGQKVIEIEVRRSGRSRIGRRLFRVYADGEEVGGLRPGNGVFPLIEWGINLRVMESRSEYLQLHAASMVVQRSGFIFAGDSGCGKSTLAAILLAHGWQYLCDEFALVDVETSLLRPFPKALCIKAGSYAITRKLGLPLARRRDYVKAFKGRVGYINARELGADRIAVPTPPRFVVFPSYCGGAAPQLTPMGRANAVMELYRCCFNKWALPAESLPALTRLVGQAECFRLAVGNPTDTAKLLESLCANSYTKVATVSARGRRANSGPFRSSEQRARLRSRREVLRVGAKLAYIAPCVLTLTAQQAFAAASNPSGICSTAKNTGELCETDTDCCSRKCNLGVCG